MKNETKVVAEPGKQELFITREFDAPRELVFKAFSDASLMQQWLSTDGNTMKIEEYDNRPGGKWRFSHCTATGQTFSFHGVMHEVAAPEMLMRTFEFDGIPEKGHVSLETAIFEPLDVQRTKITLHSVYRSVRDRDEMVKAGMERGVIEHHRRLDALFEKLLSTTEA